MRNYRNIKGPNNPNWQGGRLHCVLCDKELSKAATTKKSKHCWECYLKINKGATANSFKHGKASKDKRYYCLDCHKELSDYRVIRCRSCSVINLFKIGKLKPHTNGIWFKKYFMRSSWEIAFAKWCDKKDIKWQYEAKTFDLGNTTYTPDFYIPIYSAYVEIKGWWRDGAKEKFELFKKKYPEEEIIVLMEKDLLKLGILKAGK